MFKYVPLVISIALAGAGGTSLIAHEALVQDPFYAIKSGLDEYVMPLFLHSDQAREHLAITMIGARLEEAEKLSIEHRFNSSIEKIIEASLNDDIATMGSHIGGTQKKNAVQSDQLNFNIESILIGHYNMLGKIFADHPDQKKLADFIKDVKKNIDAVAQKSQLLNSTYFSHAVSTEQYASENLTAAQDQIKNSGEIIGEDKPQVSEYAYYRAQENMDLARNFVAQGKAQLQVHNEEGAVMLFRQATAVAQITETYVTTYQQLGVDLDLPSMKIQNITSKNDQADLSSNLMD